MIHQLEKHAQEQSAVPSLCNLTLRGPPITSADPTLANPNKHSNRALPATPLLPYTQTFIPFHTPICGLAVKTSGRLVRGRLTLSFDLRPITGRLPAEILKPKLQGKRRGAATTTLHSTDISLDRGPFLFQIPLYMENQFGDIDTARLPCTGKNCR